MVFALEEKGMIIIILLFFDDVVTVTYKMIYYSLSIRAKCLAIIL
jgi:hypothetical protein